MRQAGVAGQRRPCVSCATRADPSRRGRSRRVGRRRGEAGAEERGAGWVHEREAGNLSRRVASAIVDDAEEIRGAKVGKCRQRDRAESRPEIEIAADRHKITGPGAVRINQELEE
jgi:hypothetical protein